MLCPCEFLRYDVSRSTRHQEDPLFSFSYNGFSSKLKKTCQLAGLVGNFSSHSLRRGSATFLSDFLPLHTVKAYGDWKSWSVLLYVADSYSARKVKDRLVADRLSVYN